MPAQREVMVLSGTQLRQLLALGDVVAAVESVYLATGAQQARIYPAPRKLLPSGSVFGIKIRLPGRSRPRSLGHRRRATCLGGGRDGDRVGGQVGVPLGVYGDLPRCSMERAPDT
jgi:hypothetical protein